MHACMSFFCMRREFAWCVYVDVLNQDCLLHGKRSERLVCRIDVCRMLKGFLMCDMRMIACELFAVSKWSELFSCMIILVYGDMLIVAFVEMAGAYDRGGGSLNDHELYCYVFPSYFSGKTIYNDRNSERHVLISAARTRMEWRHRRRYGTEMLSDSCIARDESDLHAWVFCCCCCCDRHVFECLGVSLLYAMVSTPAYLRWVRIECELHV